MKLHPTSILNITRLLIPGLLFALVHPAVHAGAPFERFFGQYQGESTSIPEGEVAKRNVSVLIRPAKKGFVVEWEVEISKAEGRDKQKGLPVSFLPAKRKNIYKSAMRRDVFGHTAPMNPLKGDPFVWAIAAPDTLTVYVLRVTKSGEQDLRIHKHSLTPQGMESELIRFYGSEPIRRIRGRLRKVGASQPAAPGKPPSVPLLEH